MLQSEVIAYLELRASVDAVGQAYQAAGLSGFIAPSPTPFAIHFC